LTSLHFGHRAISLANLNCADNASSEQRQGSFDVLSPVLIRLGILQPSRTSIAVLIPRMLSFHSATPGGDMAFNSDLSPLTASIASHVARLHRVTRLKFNSA
jgi:hypothetical protein